MRKRFQAFMMSCWKLSLRFLSQWETNGGVEKKGGIIIWLSSQDQTVRAGKWAVVWQERRQIFRRVCHGYVGHIEQSFFIWFYFSGHLNVPNECLQVPKSQWHPNEHYRKSRSASQHHMPLEFYALLRGWTMTRKNLEDIGLGHQYSPSERIVDILPI